jgi:gliding motility-associated-like protein
MGGLSTAIGSINCPNTSSPTITSGIFSYPSDSQSTFPFFSLPNFPSWIFYNSNDVQIQFGPDTFYLCEGDTLVLNAGEGSSWSWGGDAASNTGQYYTVTSPGIYSATVTGPCGAGSDQIVVLLCTNEEPGDSSEVDVVFPNVFTPNSDGTNDFLEIKNLPENTEVMILNRWGNLVFLASNYQNNWNGKDASGRELVDGVYTYIFTTKEGRSGHGFVHLMR